MYYNERYNEFDRKYDYNQRDDYNYENKKPCCVKHVEETFCCYPSYYNEEKEDKRKKENEYWEGTFRAYPKKDCDKKQDNDDRYEDKCDKKEEKHECHKNHNRCCWGLCNLFRNCRW